MYTRDQNTQMFRELLQSQMSPGPPASTSQDQNQISVKDRDTKFNYMLFIVIFVSNNFFISSNYEPPW
jgi:hypothetical protein